MYRRILETLSVLSLVAPTGLNAQTLGKASGPVFKYFGDIQQVIGQRAIVQRLKTGDQVLLTLPRLPQLPQTGQPVWVSGDGAKARLVEFPITSPKVGNCVGGNSSIRCFHMETSNFLLSHDDRVQGYTRVESQDPVEGFSGSIWIRIFDADGKEIAPPTRGGCWGVKAQQSRTEWWQVTLPARSAARIATVKIVHARVCGNDGWNETLENTRAAELVLKFVELDLAKDASRK